MEQTNHNNTKIVVHPASLDMLAAATWDFAHRILWSKSQFGEDEILLSKSYIREHFEDVPAENFQQESFDRFNCFCERILSARKNYWNESRHPCLWFNRLNKDGFVKTREVHDKERRIQIKEEQESLELLIMGDSLLKEALEAGIINPLKRMRYANRNY